FQEQEAERVERPQVGCTGQRVSGVRVGLQRQVRAESVPHRPDRLNVPARLDLELDPPVALLQVTFDLAEQFGHRTGDAHRAPDRNSGSYNGPASTAQSAHPSPSVVRTHTSRATRSSWLCWEVRNGVTSGSRTIRSSTSSIFTA